MKTANSPSNFYSRCGGRLAGFVALALAAQLGTAVAPAQTASPASHAATPAASARPQAAAVPARHGEEEESEAKPNDASHQGIKIHGHWKIDIKNPDGSLASTHEFENSLTDQGSLLSYLLGSRATPGEALILLQGSPYGNILISESSTGYWATQAIFSCGSGSSVAAVACSSNLNVGVVAVPGPNGSGGLLSIYQLVLSGSVVASSTQQLTSVDTGFAACSSTSGSIVTVTPAQCKTGTVPAGTSVNDLLPVLGTSFYGQIAQGLFTGTVLTTPIQVQSGQTIQATVTLSFS